MGAIVLGIVMFMLLVLIHELGHFIAAKKSGVKVEEFGIGIPPKVLKLWTDKDGTDYTLNLIPLGGFVRLKGEDPSDPETFKAKDSFIKAKIRQKIIILLAGVAMNLLAARLIFTAIFTLGTKPIQIIPDNVIKTEIRSLLTPTKYFLYEQGFITGDIKKSVIIADVYGDGLASKAGLIGGDSLLRVDETSLNTRNIEKTLKDHIGTSFELTYQRANIVNTIAITCPGDDCLLGITYFQDINPDSMQKIQFPIHIAMLYAAKEIKAQVKMTFSFLGVFGKNIATLERKKIQNSLHKMTGPAGVVKFGEMILEAGGRKVYLGFAGIISLALAIFNVLPIPALDGGRLLGVLIQRIGRIKEEKYFNIEGYINLIFFVLLLILGLYILLQDLVRVRQINIPFIN